MSRILEQMVIMLLVQLRNSLHCHCLQIAVQLDGVATDGPWREATASSLTLLAFGLGLLGTGKQVLGDEVVNPVTQDTPHFTLNSESNPR
mgnify:CR=1 FL=1